VPYSGQVISRYCGESFESEIVGFIMWKNHAIIVGMVRVGISRLANLIIVLPANSSNSCKPGRRQREILIDFDECQV
jgi:hypothetical protein